MVRPFYLLKLVHIFGFLLFCAPLAQASKDHHVILITLDGFPAYLMTDPQAPIPTLRKLASEGTLSEGMRVSNPSVTWPNHTTLVTGVHPDQHSVLFNGALERSRPGIPVRINGQKNKADLVGVPTVYDLLHKAGYRTAGINWPCTRNSGTLDDDFPDVPQQIEYTTPKLRDELVEAGILSDHSQKSFQSHSSAGKDQIWTAAALHVIKKRKPNFMLMHMLITDSIHHKYGAQSPAGYTAVGMADAQVRELVEALDESGIRDKTSLFIVSDHGFENALKVLNPNVLFRKAGLLETNRNGAITNARVQCMSSGGMGMIYCTDPTTRAAARAKVRSIMEGQDGIASIIEPEEFEKLGMPHPDRNPQMADLLLTPEPGFAFGSSAGGDNYINEVTLAAGNQGYHGYLSSNPKMNAVFIAWGRGIKRGAKIGLVENIDVAPTVAKLLGQTMPGTRGKPLEDILIGSNPLNKQ